MSRLILILLFLAILALDKPVYGQIYEVGVYGGISAYRGDLNQTKLFNKTHGAGGIMLRYAHNQHVSARLNMGYSVLRGADTRSDNPHLIFSDTINDFSFETTLLELSLQTEVNFLPFTAGDPETLFSPYIFGGIGGIFFKPQIYKNKTPYGGTEHLENPTPRDIEDTGSSIAAIGLVGFGIKLNVARNIVADAAWGFRFSNTDYLDEVSLRGNPKDNDYYSIIGLTVTYKFLDRSRPPCPMHRFPN